MDGKTLKKAYRNAWILVILVAAFSAVFFALTLAVNGSAPEPQWDMGGVPFVPASSDRANGYYSPVSVPKEGADE